MTRRDVPPSRQRSPRHGKVRLVYVLATSSTNTRGGRLGRHQARRAPPRLVRADGDRHRRELGGSRDQRLRRALARKSARLPARRARGRQALGGRRHGRLNGKHTLTAALDEDKAAGASDLHGKQALKRLAAAFPKMRIHAPTAMPEAIARHYEILDEVIARHGGVRPVEQGEGDSVVAVFTRARDAVAAALDAQRGVLAEEWPIGAELRVRMALHTGDAQLRDEGNNVGAAVIRCARLRAVAHGGQVLLSGATAELVADHASRRRPYRQSRGASPARSRPR